MTAHINDQDLPVLAICADERCTASGPVALKFRAEHMCGLSLPTQWGMKIIRVETDVPEPWLEALFYCPKHSPENQDAVDVEVAADEVQIQAGQAGGDPDGTDPA